MDGLTEQEIAGTRITSRVLQVPEGEPIGNVKRMIRELARELEVLDYVYLTDSESRLVGVASLKEILQSSDDVGINSIMKKHPVSVDFHADQERLIYVVLQNNLKAIPVVDKENRLKGVVPFQAILEVFHHEFQEDILRSGGIHHMKEVEELTTSASKLVRARLPSLMIGLLGGLVAAFMVSSFENLLAPYFVLAAFIPVIIYLSDAVGTQSQTLIVRRIALEPDFSVRSYILREIRVGSILGAIFSSLLFVAAALVWDGLHFGIVIGSSMFLSMVFQAFVSTYLSVSLAKSKIDPALASGPITTIISDITSLALYFSLATVLLGYFS